MFANSATAVFAGPHAGVVGLHQHYVQTPAGEVAIAEQFCDGEQSVAFDNLHINEGGGEHDCHDKQEGGGSLRIEADFAGQMNRRGWRRGPLGSELTSAGSPVKRAGQCRH